MLREVLFTSLLARKSLDFSIVLRASSSSSVSCFLITVWGGSCCSYPTYCWGSFSRLSRWIAKSNRRSLPGSSRLELLPSSELRLSSILVWLAFFFDFFMSFFIFCIDHFFISSQACASSEASASRFSSLSSLYVMGSLLRDNGGSGGSPLELPFFDT